MENQQLLSPSDNAPAHRSIMVKDFLVGCGGCGLDRAGSEYGKVAGTCDCGNESSGSIKCGEFLD